MASFLNKAKAKVEELTAGSQNKNDNQHSTSHTGDYGHTKTSEQYGTGHHAGSTTTSDTYGSTAGQTGYDNPRSASGGPHSSNLANKADPRVDSDYDGRNDPTSRVGGVGHTQQYGDNYGQTGSAGGIASSDTGYGTHTGQTGSTGYTGHSEPTAHTGHTGVMSQQHHTGYTGRAGGLSETAATGTGVGGAGTSYTTGVGNEYDNPRSTNAGPHSSNLMNKADPRHDSDRDHRNDPTSRVGGYGTQGGDYGHNTGAGLGGTESSYGTTGNTYDNPRSTNAGPHSSNLMNKADPRHDSDRDHRNDPTSRIGGSGVQGEVFGHTPVHEATTHPTHGSEHGSGVTGGYGSSHTGSHGVGHSTDTAGGYGSGHKTGNTGGYDDNYTPGSGTAQNTAGPHNSDILNKLDPRVDSDLDGSKTYGGNQTHR